MSATISKFLNERKEEIANMVNNAEKSCGYPLHDTRLLAEIAAEVKNKTLQLGLDPEDTTSRELYYNLRTKAKKDGQNFAKQLGFRSKDDQITRLEDVFRHSLENKKGFALKSSVAKKLLLSSPPKQLMRRINYRTADSMIKREDVNGLFAVAFNVESALWRKRLTKSLKKLKPQDFREIDLEFTVLGQKISKLSKQSSVPVFLTGAVCLNPQANFFRSPLYSSLEILNNANQVLHWGFAVKQQQLNKGFSKYLADNFDHEPTGEQMTGNWNVNFAHLSRSHDSPTTLLSKMNLGLEWWKNTSHVARESTQRPVSLNIHDLLTDQLAGSGYENRSTKHFSQAFWQKLLNKYIEHPQFETSILQKLNPEPILAEDFADEANFEVSNSLRTV